MKMLTMKAFLFATLLCSAAFAPTLRAQGADGAAALPEWDQLPQTQRDALVAPLRERWNRNPADRGRMLERADRWKTMSPEQRGRADRGIKRWEHMDPDKREQMRALFERTRDLPPAQRREAMALFHAMRKMTPEQRDALRSQWAGMTADQRAQWVRDNAPKRGHRRRRDDAGAAL